MKKKKKMEKQKQHTTPTTNTRSFSLLSLVNGRVRGVDSQSEEGG